MSGVMLSAVLASALIWPFGSSDDRERPPSEETLKSLEGRRYALPPDEPIPDAEQRAREAYRALLQLPGLDPEIAAEATRRLGDLELESGEAQALSASEQDDRVQAEAYRDAAALYRELLAKHPDYPRNDLVLYQLARAEESGGDPAAALTALDQLIQRYPQTPIVEEVQFRRGELLFSEQRYQEAESAYAAVVGSASEQFHDEALYKLGWSQFKQGEYEASLDSFFALLDGRFAGIPADRVDAEIEAMSRPERELLDDSLEVMSLSFSYLEGVDSLQRTLARRGQPAYGSLNYLSLSQLYLDQQRYVDAAGVLMSYAKANPQQPRAPYLYMQAIAALEKGRFPGEALAARQTFVENFGLDKPYWQAQDRATHQAVVDYLRDSIWLLAQQAHAEAQRAKPPERAARYQAAIANYRSYLEYFPTDARAAEAQFLLGEALFEIGDYAAAVASYEAAAYREPRDPRSAEAGYASLLAYAKQESKLAGEPKSQWHERRLAAELRFADSFPDHERAVLARGDAARGYYADKDYRRAIEAAQAITADAKAPAQQRRDAWQLIGLANFDQNRYAEAESAFIEAQRLDEAAGKHEPALTEQLAASIYKQGEAARSAGDPRAAAEAFERVARLTPEASIRPTADYDAAQARLAAGDTAAGIAGLEAYRRAYPRSELADKVDASLAVAYADSGQPAAAAQQYQRIAAGTADPKLRREALLQAADLYAKGGDRLREADTLKAFVDQRAGSFDETVEALQRLIGLAAARGDENARMDWSRRLVAYERAGGADRTDRTRYLAAHASLELAEALRASYESVRLVAPLKTSLATKRKRMEEALAAYASAAEYGVADVQTAATYRTGELYHALAQALYDSERPANLDAEAREQYELLLDEQAYPFEDKAAEIHAANAQRAAEGIYDDWVRKSYAALAQLKPARWAKTERQEPYVDAIR
jgi:TolA-binding protein